MQEKGRRTVPGLQAVAEVRYLATQIENSVTWRLVHGAWLGALAEV
jgi:hypothetical protein